MIQRLWRSILTIVLCLSLWGFSLTPVWATVSPEMEKNILEVIEKHPEVILRSVMAYQQQQQEQQLQAQEQLLSQVKQQLPQLIGTSPVLGDRNAPVTLIEFADFECSFCRKAHPDLQTLHRHHPQMAFVFKHLPIPGIHSEAMAAAAASWAAQQQGKFWEYHDALLETKQPLGEPAYRIIAQRLRLDMEKFEHDRQSSEAQEAIRQDMAWSEVLRIQGTPFFLVSTPSTLQAVSGADMPLIEAMVSNSTG